MHPAGVFSISNKEISVSLMAYLLATCFHVASPGRRFLLRTSITACLVPASISCKPLNPTETKKRSKVNRTERVKRRITSRDERST